MKSDVSSSRKAQGISQKKLLESIEIARNNQVFCDQGRKHASTGKDKYLPGAGAKTNRAGLGRTRVKSYYNL